MDLFKNNCPVCYGGNLKTIYHTVRLIKGVRSSYRFDYDVKYCRDCGLLQNQPNNEEILEKFYNDSLSEVVGREVTKEALNNYFFDIKRIKKANPKVKNILEIGCSDGNFLLAATKSKLSAFGIEPSLQYAKIARRKSKCPVWQTTFESWSGPGKQVDAIIAYYVFEHMFDPHDFLQRCYKLLKPNGVLFIEIPVLERFKPGITDLFVFEHPFHYSIKTAARLFRQYFSDVKVIEKSFGTEVGAKFICKKIIKLADDYKLAQKYLEKKAVKYAKIKNGLKQVFNTDRPIVLFGGGETARKILSMIPLRDKGKIAAIADNDTRKSGTFIDRIKIDLPEKVFKKYTAPPLVICCLDYSLYVKQAKEQCKKLGVELTLLSGISS